MPSPSRPLNSIALLVKDVENPAQKPLAALDITAKSGVLD